MADARQTRRRALVAGLLLLGVAILLVGPRAADEATDDPRMSTYLASPDGARGLYLALEALELPVARHRLPPAELAPGGSLVLLRPALPPDSAAVADLRAWVEDGGTLILAPEPDEAAGPPGFPGGLHPGLVLRTLDEPAPLRLPTDADAPHPWLAEVDDADLPSVDHVWDGVPEDAGVLLATPEGDPVLLRLPLGEGGLVAWSDPAPLRNEALREDPAAAFPLVRAARDHAPVRFDEYHQGFRGEGSPARALLDFLGGTGWGHWTLQGALAALLLLLLAGHRFGRPRPLLEERGRSPLEHADALASVYRKASAHRTARRRLLTGLHRSLGLRPGPELALPPGLRDTPAARRLAREWARGDDADLAALTRAMDDFLSEARG